MISNIEDISKPPTSERGFSFLTKERLILYSIIIGLIFSLIYMFFGNKEIAGQLEYNNKKIDSLQIKNDILLQKNLDIEDKINTFENNINNIDNKILSNISQLNKFKAETNEKINAIDSSTRDERRSFFTTEYPE